MVQPIDYSSAFGGGSNPLQEFTQAAQAGFSIRNAQAQQTQLEQQQAAQKQMQADMAALSANPNPQSIAQMALKYPQLSEQFKRSYDMLDSSQQQARLNASVPVFAAIQSGRPDLASKQLRDRAAALANSGQEGESKQITAMADLIDQHPETAKLTIGTLLASVMGPDKFANTFSTLGQESRAQDLQPAALKKAEADANSAVSDSQTKAVVAKFAEPQALKDLELKGWNVENIKSEIGYRKEANRIAAMGVALAQKKDAREAEELKLKIEAAKTALDEKTRAKVADVESATSSIDNLLNTADRLLTAGTEIVDRNGEKVAVPNSTLRAATGPLDSRMPTIQRDVADLEALAETLGSQAFISQIEKMKGTGALSEKEGDKLQSSLTNLSLRQSPEQLIANVKEAQRLMLKARSNVEKRYGVKAGVPDTPAVQTPGSDIDALVKKYGAAPKAGGG